MSEVSVFEKYLKKNSVYQGMWDHPDLFEDMDPEAMHQEYMARLQEMDYDVKGKGLFV